MLPTFSICLMLFVPAIIAQLVGLNAQGAGYAYLSAVFKLMALMGLVFMGLVAMAALTISKRPIPILTIDTDALATPLMKLPWASIRAIFVTKYLGVVPVLCITTTDDKALIAKRPLPYSIRYLLNQKIVGAPISIPAVREMALQDLAALIDQYRSAGVDQAPAREAVASRRESKVNISIATGADEIRKKALSLDPYRHVQLAMLLTNDDGFEVERLAFEILIPEEAIFDLSGDAWHPSHRHEVEGTIYDVWDNRGGSGRYAAPSSWLSGGPALHFEQNLAVNLKPYPASIVIRWRVFEREEPIGNGSQELTFQPFVPAL